MVGLKRIRTRKVGHMCDLLLLERGHFHSQTGIPGAPIQSGVSCQTQQKQYNWVTLTSRSNTAGEFDSEEPTCPVDDVPKQ